MSETVIVTGGSGFIGSAACRKLLSGSARVINCDIQTYAAAQGTNKNLRNNPNYKEVNIDICNRDALEWLFHKERPVQVWHLAAETHVDRSIDTPEKFIQTNVVGTATLLQVASRYWSSATIDPNFRFIHVSTDEVYGSADGESRFTEEHPYRPSSPYSASKASSDHLVLSWHETYGLPVIVVNCVNNYGSYQFPEKLIPKTIVNAISGQKIPLYGTGENVREWLFVEDCVDAILMLARRGKIGQKYNIGSGQNTSNRQIVQRICEVLDTIQPSAEPYYKLVEFVHDRPGHDYRYAVNSTKARLESGWSPRHSLSDALELTVRWYLENEWWWRPLLANGATSRHGMTQPRN